MARTRIGLIYNYDKRWIAGAYYMANLVEALKVLEDSVRPHLTILSYEKEGQELIREIDYPYISYKVLPFEYSFLQRLVNRVGRMLCGRNIVGGNYTNNDFTAVYPFAANASLDSVKHKIYWVPDLQHHFLPGYFTKEEIHQRNALQADIAKSSSTVVFSSEDSAGHFRQFNPGCKSKIFVLNFSVTHPQYSHIDLKELNKRFDIDRPYFFLPNQFWAHKNHKVVVEALKLLKQQGDENILVVFSGKESDYRNPGHVEQLKKNIEDYGVSSMVRSIGFVDRAEQLQLMKHSLAVVQPSLFEGWSTVIEDVKAMNQYAVVSSLAVHKEQLKENAVFFDPSSATELAGILKDISSKPPALVPVDYKGNKIKFAKDFINMVDELDGRTVK